MKLEDEIKQKKFKNEFQKLALNIIFTGNWLNSNSIKTFKPFGISPQQYNVLRILKGQHPDAISVNCIAERMLDKNSNASRLVDKLKIKNLVKREICEHDRRQVDIAITDKGIDLLKQMESISDLIDAKIKSSLSDDEAAQLNLFLDKIRG
ncbi:MarR family transcriptional regulator [Vicingus serpentipes]|jgi:DNA-binding MarR family transcriptional regulator|uniref:MarR family transcriptional regulator n=1 Tax=Vicingus serpentipes TaxID=1926625 RepID=A0A5C6RVR7_9FLAO|nr:MarR family transcriptional regulator [Vicingus serpentipes]TXB65979.1 MarR family transcriptional regulator [Vicingus serpentipes]